MKKSIEFDSPKYNEPRGDFLAARRSPNTTPSKQDRTDEERHAANRQSTDESSTSLLCSGTKVSQDIELANTSPVSPKRSSDPTKIGQKPQEQKTEDDIQGKH